MPIEEVGTVVIEVTKVAVEAVLDLPEPTRKKNWFLRVLYWLAILLGVSFLGFVAYMALASD